MKDRAMIEGANSKIDPSTAAAETAEAESGEQEKQANKTKNDRRETGETREVGGPKGPEPTRYGDWERKGRCIDF